MEFIPFHVSVLPYSIIGDVGLGSIFTDQSQLLVFFKYTGDKRDPRIPSLFDSTILKRTKVLVDLLVWYWWERRRDKHNEASAQRRNPLQESRIYIRLLKPASLDKHRFNH